MTSFKSAARPPIAPVKGAESAGLRKKIPAKLQAKFDQAEAAMKGGNAAKAAQIYGKIAARATQRGKHGAAARVGMRAARAHMKAKDMAAAAEAMKSAVASAAQAKNRDKMLARLKKVHTRMAGKGREKAATMLAQNVKASFGVDL